METVTSADGTTIAYDKAGEGPTVILVAGAFSFRKYPKQVQIADLLANEGFTTINYDRRGRGDSGDTAPYAVEREIEDIAALIDANGGSVYVWGLSSGAALSLRAAAAGLNIKKLAIYQPPFIVDEEGHVPPPDLAERLDEMIANDRRSEAVKFFMTKAFGAPAFFINIMRLTPVWKRLKAVAHTLPYDYALVNGAVDGKPLPAEPWGQVTIPTLVMAGAKAPALAKKGSQAIHDLLPDSQHQLLEGQGIDVAPAKLVPVLAEYFKS